MRYLAFAFLSTMGIAFSCECEPLTECAVARRPVIFIGKVVAGGVASIRDDPWYKDSKFVRFEVVEIMRGLAAGTKLVDIETTLWPGMCSPNPYQPGRTYLVTPSVAKDGKLSDGICFTGRNVERASVVIEHLRKQFQNPQQTSIRGRVGAIRQKDFRLYDYLLTTGAVKALQGAKVSTTAVGKTVSTTTDAQGRYELAVPGPGQYSIQVGLAPYPPAKESIDIRANAACAVWDFGLVSNSSISGKVLNRSGRPLDRAEVGLIDLDRPLDEHSAGMGIRIARAKPAEGTFQFEDVPIGRYLLVFNPEGPQTSRFRSVPYESTYYPNGTGRAGAQTIEINRAGMRLIGKDVTAGPPVPFRTVDVRVRFSDRSPMSTALVEVIGEPLEPGGTPWRGEGVLPEGQSQTRIHVPANRKFRISVLDRYGRDLKRAYQSTHLPGTTPVSEEFVIAVPK